MRRYALTGLLTVWSTLHAAPATPRRIYFPATEDGDDDAHVRVVLPIEQSGDNVAEDVVAYNAGRIAPLSLRPQPTTRI